jgi:hypothetical protein
MGNWVIYGIVGGMAMGIFSKPPLYGGGFCPDDVDGSVYLKL